MPQKQSRRVTEVVVLTTAMLTFISFWRAAAIVLCDLASTAWYIGGIVEQAIGKSAPWFILGVMLFSYAIRSVYMESCSMFVRGGVYKVVKEAMGGTLAKLSAAAIMFDYTLTGPISAVSAGQYMAGLLNSSFPYLRVGWHVDPPTFSILFAIAGTLYFWRENIKGIPESSDKSLKIMWMTTGMAGVMLVWCSYTLWVRGFQLPPFELKFTEEALGWSTHFDFLRPIGAIGLVMAFGHSMLAMSGEETLAQVYRELESPKIKNLARTGMIIFIYSLMLTSLVSFFAVMIIPDGIRISKYGDNLLAGLAMSVVGPHWLRLLLQAMVVGVGALILMGAANTSIVGANGILNRLAEDRVIFDWFRKLHPRYGTTHRTINVIVLLQIFTIIACGGDVYVLGEAYAFGVIWSFVFKTAAVMVLRFKDVSPREFMVPLNVKLGKYELPIGLSLIFLVLFITACMNLLTKKVATISGFSFTVVFYTLFHLSEKYGGRLNPRGDPEAHEQLNLRNEHDLAAVLTEIDKPNRVVVAVRNSKNLYHLQKVLDTLDSRTTDLIVLHSKIDRTFGFGGDMASMGPDEGRVFSRVISMAEKCGKSVVPLMVISNDPAYSVAQAAQAVGASEVVMGVSSRIGLEDQLERLAMTWGALQAVKSGSSPVRFRILGEGKELSVDL